MTGPPDIFANGGIFRHIKKELFEGSEIRAFMTEIFHFLEFSVGPGTLERWLEVDIPTRVKKLVGYEPFLFVDSGGYRLLYNTGVDLTEFGLEPTVGTILRLQARLGGDMVATLDYPLPPNIHDAEAIDRIRRTRSNSLECLQLVDEEFDSGLFVQLAVHGRSRNEAEKSTADLLEGVRRRGLEDTPFGIAIGSLVPLANSPSKIVEIVHGVVEGIGSCEWMDPGSVPVHAFGVSSRLIPYLALMGVDTFDGLTYVQSARHLEYLTPGTFSATPFLKLDALTCRCRHCERMQRAGLQETKRLLKGRGYRSFIYDGKTANKSYIYSLIALHNLELTLSEIEKIRHAAVKDFPLEEVFTQGAQDRKLRRVLAYVARIKPEVAEFLWTVGVKGVRSSPSTLERKESDEAVVLGGTTSSQEAKEPERTIRLSLGPDAFNVNEIGYMLPKSRVLLLLPCSRQKPYGNSRSHKAVNRIVAKLDAGEGDIHKVTISGNYGPVPEEFENHPEVQEYDFYLSPHDKERKELLVSRLLTFLQEQESRFGHVLAYCTTKSYREVIESVFQDFPNATMLPDPLKARRQSEFLKKENLSQLQTELRRIFGRGGG